MPVKSNGKRLYLTMPAFQYAYTEHNYNSCLSETNFCCLDYFLFLIRALLRKPEHDNRIRNLNTLRLRMFSIRNHLSNRCHCKHTGCSARLQINAGKNGVYAHIVITCIVLILKIYRFAINFYNRIAVPNSFTVKASSTEE